MEFFVNRNSIVRKIWGKGDTVLFIFACASAEFALNKAVDWLYFTGKLPADPLGRLFSTVSYARGIVFSKYTDAVNTINTISMIHQKVEEKREEQIPDWSYRDVLFMLIDYSIRSFELLERKLTAVEKNEVYEVFYRLGTQMKLINLPLTYSEWLPVREEHLRDDLAFSPYTADLYKQYKKHLGPVRYLILKQAQILIVPERVNKLLSLGKIPFLLPVLQVYKWSRMIKMEGLLRNIILPSAYKEQIRELDIEK